VSDYKFLSIHHRARLARVATILIVTAAYSGVQAAQPKKQQSSESSAPSGAPAKKDHQFAEKTSEAFGKLKPLQEKQDYAGMLALLESIPVTPGSYD
jgi:hypothetical protein